MKKGIYMMLLAVGLLAVAMTTASPVMATCGPEPNIFLQGNGGCPGYNGFGYCYVVSPGVNTVASINSDFWAFAFGDPTNGLGDDNGTWEDDKNYPAFSWLRCYVGDCANYQKYLSGSWDQDAGIDGCITNKVATDKTAEIMVVAFSDSDAAESTAFFAAATALRDPVPATNYDFANLGQSHIKLVEIPRPTITNAQCAAGDCTSVDVTVSCPDLSAGFYTDGSATASEVIQGCEVFQQIVGRGAAAPATRAASAWTDTTVVAPQGGTATVTLSCGTDSDAYLAFGVAFDSGFVTSHVSANSTRIECGPTLADPTTPKFKLVKPGKEPRIKRKKF